jgi:hypothetical protein
MPRYRIALIEEDRKQLDHWVSAGKSAARKLAHARILLLADEARKQLIGEVAIPLPLHPGQPHCEDYEYERKGVCNLFMFFEPLPWRHVKVTQRRIKKDWAEAIRELVDVHNPPKIRLVMSNLNRHTGSSLYEAFHPEEARRILERLEIHFTAKHACWLNMAEIEIGVQNGQCLDRRIDGPNEPRQGVLNWEVRSNHQRAKIHWTFTITRARVKMKKVYPSIEL